MKIVELIKKRMCFNEVEAELFWLIGTFSSDLDLLADYMGRRRSQIDYSIDELRKKTGASNLRELAAYAHVCLQRKVGPLAQRKKR